MQPNRVISSTSSAPDQGAADPFFGTMGDPYREKRNFCSLIFDLWRAKWIPNPDEGQERFNIEMANALSGCTEEIDSIRRILEELATKEPKTVNLVFRSSDYRLLEDQNTKNDIIESCDWILSGIRQGLKNGVASLDIYQAANGLVTGSFSIISFSPRPSAEVLDTPLSLLTEVLDDFRKDYDVHKEKLRDRFQVVLDKAAGFVTKSHDEADGICKRINSFARVGGLTLTLDGVPVTVEGGHNGKFRCRPKGEKNALDYEQPFPRLQAIIKPPVSRSKNLKN